MPRMLSYTSLLAAALASTQPADGGVSRCLGIAVPMSGLRAAHLDDDSVARLRRFAREHRSDAYRIHYVVFAPYGFDRGTTTNREATQLRGEVVRAHLIAAGLDGDRIRVMRLGEHASYPFPPGMVEAEQAARRRGGRAETRANAASVTLEIPAAAGGCDGGASRPR